MTGKERRALRGQGQTKDVAVTVGKNGLIPTVIATLKEAILREPLLKVRIAAETSEAREELARQIAIALKAESIGGVGRNFLFFKLPKPGKG